MCYQKAGGVGTWVITGTWFQGVLTKGTWFPGGYNGNMGYNRDMVSGGLQRGHGSGGLQR